MTKITDADVLKLRATAEELLAQGSAILTQLDAWEAVKSIQTNQRRSSSALTVIKLVAARLGVPFRDIADKSRMAEIVEARHLAVWLARNVSHESLAGIGRLVARDHGSVLHAIHAIEDRRATEPDFLKLTDELRGWVEAQLRNRFLKVNRK